LFTETWISKQMLTDFERGQLAYAASNTRCVAKLQRLTGFDRRTIAKYLAVDFERQEIRRAVPERIRKRRRVIRRLAIQLSRCGDRSWPTYGSASQVQQALLNKTGEALSRRHVSRELRAIGFRSFVRPTVPTRTKADFEKRRAFAKRARTMTSAATKKIVFSDESWLSCIERTGRTQWAKRRSDVCAREKKARWNVPSIMIWSTIGHNWKGPLVIFPSKHTKDGEVRQFRLDAKGYVRRCLSTVVARLVRERRIFQQDGARSHVAKSTLKYLNSKSVRMLEGYPAYSPDLNAIERIWKEVHERVGRLCPMTQTELIACARKVWAEVPQQLINKHCAHFATQIASM
jgi:hypothetical protein